MHKFSIKEVLVLYCSFETISPDNLHLGLIENSMTVAAAICKYILANHRNTVFFFVKKLASMLGNMFGYIIPCHTDYDVYA